MKAFKPRNIKARFAACRLFPFNLHQVLNTIMKPPELTTAEVNKAIVGPCKMVGPC